MTSSYDQVPYHSWPYAQSHPDRLASMATLFGLAPQPIDHARVLEIGCSSGGNLLPMAETLPQSAFLGIDLSRNAIDAGRKIADQLSLKNIELRQMDVRDFQTGEGCFHYILAHGVFSWVPTDVQEKIFEICRENLEPNGVAYISYNTFPGWRMRGIIRDMMVYHIRDIHEPGERIEQAQALLQFMADSVPTDDNPYGIFLQREAKIIHEAGDAYLFHDHLERDNEPIYFHDFVERAERHGLQYLAESHLGVMASCNFAGNVDETLQRISRDIIEIEQYMDFLRNRTFRQTLLCHARQPLDRSLDPQRLEALSVAAELCPENLELNLGVDERVKFWRGNLKVETADPMIKAALLVLHRAWPTWIAFESLVDRARLLVAEQRGTNYQEPDNAKLKLGEHLIRCFASAAIEIHSALPHFVTEISERPCASPLMRLQARLGKHVTNRKHETATLDDFSRELIVQLDGETALHNLDLPGGDSQRPLEADTVQDTLQAISRAALLV